MRNMRVAGAYVLIFFATQAPAADFSDPEWPCIQRKVEQLSIGLMWPGLLEPDRTGVAAHRQLAARLSQRRTRQAEAETAVMATKSSGAWNASAAAAVFSDVFLRVSDQRQKVIAGIKRYATKQNALAEKIEALRGEMAVMSAAATPDFDRIDALEEQLDWEERIFRDRAKSLTYVCETPVLLEKHIYAVGQILRASAE